MVDEPSKQLVASVPVSLAQSAAKVAADIRPGITQSGMVRLALARLCGLSDDYGAEIRRGPKQRAASTT